MLEIGDELVVRPAELAVPRVGIFVRQDIAAEALARHRLEIAGFDRVLGRAVMLHADPAHFVRHRHQEVIVVIVAGAEQLVSFLDHVLVDLQHVIRNLQIVRIVGDDVHVHRHLGAGIQVVTLEVTPGQDGGIDQVVVGNRLEGHDVAVPAVGFQRRAVIPALRQGQGQLDRNAPRIITRRIERGAPHLQIHRIARMDDLTVRRTDRRQVLKIGRDRLRARWHIDVEGVHGDQVARPRDFLAVDEDVQPGQLGRVALGRMRARDPFGLEQRHGAGRGDGDCLVDIDDMAIDIAGVDAQVDRAGIVDVLGHRQGRRIGRRHRQGLRPGSRLAGHQKGHQGQGRYGCHGRASTRNRASCPKVARNVDRTFWGKHEASNMPALSTGSDGFVKPVSDATVCR